MPTEALIELTDIPESDAGAPCPVVYATEHKVLVAYHLADGKVDGAASGAVVFEGVNSHVFGSPNDETLHGHRLAKLGLKPYSFSEVRNSSWIAELCARNRVHPHHQDPQFEGLRHFIFTFHDTTLEVAARTYAPSAEPGRPIDCVTRRLSDRSTWS
jgi:hypothetical protein